MASHLIGAPFVVTGLVGVVACMRGEEESAGVRCLADNRFPEGHYEGSRASLA